MEVQSTKGTEPVAPAYLKSVLRDLRPAEGILAGSVLMYSAGFVVSNVYLGSLGVLNLDILRVRYITTGILFAVFLATVLYPLHGITSVFREHRDKPIRGLVGALFNRTWDRWGLIWLISLFLGGAVSYRNRPFPMPGEATDRLWSSWVANRAPQVLEQAPRFFLSFAVAMAGLLILLASLIVVLNPKNKAGERRGRLKLLGELSETIFRGLFSWRALAWVVAALLVALVLDYLSFYANTRITVFPVQVDPSIGRFLAIPFLVYLLFTTYLFILFVGPRPDVSSSPIRQGSDLAIAALFAGILIPLYSLAVYPSLPQQIGGGRPIPVEVTFEAGVVPPQTKGSLQESLYLVDRGEWSFILLIPEASEDEYAIIEVPESSITSIRYVSPSP